MTTKGNIKRKPDWRNRLSIWAAEMSRVPFGYEHGNDCGKFVANGIEAMTGTDPLKGMRSYSTEQGAAKLVRKKGYKSHVDVVAELFEEIPPAHATAGDIVVLKENDGLGIHQGQFIYTPGIALVDPGNVKRAFRVPEE